MRKYLYTIMLLAFLVQGFSQKHFDNRFTIDYTKQLGGGVFTGNVLHLLQDYWDERRLSTKNMTALDHNLSVDYKLNRKVSLVFTGNYLKYDFVSINNIYSENLGYNIRTVNRFRINKYGYGIGFNFYLNSNYAPLGTSIGVQYFVNNYYVNDNDKFYRFLKRGEAYTELTPAQKEKKIKYRTNTLKINVNFVSMLSDKIPLFYRYGFNVNLPIVGYINDEIKSAIPFENYNLNSYGYSDDGLLKKFKLDYIANLYVGIGYLF